MGGGAGKSDIARLSQLGIMIGQAFQIQDDILGIFGSQKSIGKSILSDITEFKKTLLVCHAYKRLDLNKRLLFMRYFSKAKKSYRDLVAIRKIFLNSGSLRYSLYKIKSLLDKSRDTVDRLEMKDSYRRLIWDSLILLFNTSDKIAEKNNIDIRID